MKKVFLVVSVIIFASTNFLFAQKAKKDKVLDGAVYEINLQEENAKKTPRPVVDVLKFKGGKLSSEVMEDKYAFKKATFTYVIDSTDAENVKTHFNCDMENEMKEVVKWDGDIEEDAIEGKILWMKKDKIKKSFSFSGSVKRKK